MPESTLETLIRQIAREEAQSENADLKQKLEVQERILAKIPFRVSTAEAMNLTGIKSDRTLKKKFTPMQDGPKGRITYSLVDIERWVAEKELSTAA